MLDFCPYESDSVKKEFMKIDLDNLAYEIIFIGNFKYDDLKDTVIATGYENYIKQNHRANLIFNDHSVHYILTPKTGKEESGISRLMAAIEKENSSSSAAKEASASGETDGGYVLGSANSSSGFGKKEKIALECELDEDTGNYIISSAADSSWGKRPIMKAVPCCPNCYMPLPVGWLYADNFFPVSLMGRTFGGKTTYMLSLMANNWDALEALDSGWIVSAAHETMGEGEISQERGYEWMKKASEEMVRTGRCPDPTQTGFTVKPVFLNVLTSDGHSLIAGFYDNSGENLKEMAANDPRMLLLANMEAHIYFIDPSQTLLPVEDGKQEKEAPGKQADAIRLMSLEEQGDYQSKNAGKPPVSARELLEGFKEEKGHGHVHAPKHIEDPLTILKRYQKLLVNMRTVGRMKKQRVYMTLTKCDMLENIPEIQDFSFSQILFQRGTPAKLFGDQQVAREQVVGELFRRYVFDSIGKEKFLEKNLASFSYHCISSLGCGTAEREENGTQVYYLDGEYDPIRVAEPVACCLKRRIEDLGWEQEDF